jgi:hypothetical protein
MTDDLTEAAFAPLVGNNLAARFGPDAVYRQPQGDHEWALPSGDVPDYLCVGPLGLFVVEVENTTATLKEAVGQARMYCREYGRTHAEHAFPVVALPTTVGDHEALRDARDEVRVLLIDPTPTPG